MKLSDEILHALPNYVQKNRGSDIMIPNYFYGGYEYDLFVLRSSGPIVEYEAKISRSDFFADFKKYDRKGLKHELIEQGRGSANRFFFVVPEGLVSVDEVPKYAGLIYYTKYKHFKIVQNAPILRKQKAPDLIWKQLSISLSYREMYQRRKVNLLQQELKRQNNKNQ